MLSDIEIARAANMLPIEEIAEKIGLELTQDDIDGLTKAELIKNSQQAVMLQVTIKVQQQYRFI